MATQWQPKQQKQVTIKLLYNLFKTPTHLVKNLKN